MSPLRGSWWIHDLTATGPCPRGTYSPNPGSDQSPRSSRCRARMLDLSTQKQLQREGNVPAKGDGAFISTLTVLGSQAGIPTPRWWIMFTNTLSVDSSQQRQGAKHVNLHLWSRVRVIMLIALSSDKLGTRSVRTKYSKRICVHRKLHLERSPSNFGILDHS